MTPKVYEGWPFDAAEAKRRQEETAEILGAPVERTIDLGRGESLELVLIPAGEFLMGSPANEEGRKEGEGPEHWVRITKPFYMSKTQTTWKQWKWVMGENRGDFKGETNPVGQVSWYDCEEFIRRLNARAHEKGSFALPTEAEWEYACRGGTDTPFHTGGTISTIQANMSYGHESVPVGGFRPNAFGLYDMHGNVFEWCRDWYGEDYYRTSPKDNPRGPATGEHRVFRGGCYSGIPEVCRSAYRGWFMPSEGLENFGFRAALRDFE